MDFIDVAIIGGGPAGLTAAATLARQLHTAVVFDSKSYRNAKATKMHMVPTWENKNPADFRSAARRDIETNYSTIQFADIPVTKVEKKNDAHFQVWDGNNKEWNFRKVLLAVGSSDTYPDIEGYEQLWTKKIFHCLFCHGYEDRGSPSSGVLAVSPILIPGLAIHMAENAAQLSDSVTIYTHGNDDLTTQLLSITDSKFKVESRQIKHLLENTEADSVTVEFEDGSNKVEKFLVHSPLTSVQGPFVGQLGIALTPMGDIQADAPAYQTSVRGVFAAGDCITPYKVTPGAISSGCNAAVAASTQLQAEKHGLPAMF
ncbi:FAD/NAD(P)-binding domain-containing protein [Annulohypoxylon maeteangense]|uniref:FAD/NAD(P)-binding domain-containing protein n=1 Tax=Annulohypoxylon maeteangense TaxID=1927788 RepID=UPI00200725D6|nr:FAD/NAD(P)-binding domain-containing protein [Annulohypoxylon maeteangense]KAI0883506.1 FAD/NAD(P)-binding domain-containing protein [Annulohypoxylon maeteangense]